MTALGVTQEVTALATVQVMALVVMVLETMVQGIRALTILNRTIRTQVNQRCSNLSNHSPAYSSNSREAPRNSNNQELLRSNNSNPKPVNRYNSSHNQRSRLVNNNKPLHSSNSRNPHNSPRKFSNLFPSSPHNNLPFRPRPSVKQALRVQLSKSKAVIVH